MQKNFVLFIAGFLFFLNIFAWQEVFDLESRFPLEVDFLSVGQGDSAFIQTSENHQILIDGGPTSAVLQKLAERMPFWDKTLDLVVLTHPESDHMQGLLYVLQRYKADYILWSGIKKTSSEYKEWVSVLEKQKQMGAKILIAQSDQEIKAGKILIDTIYPFKSLEGQEIKNTSNDSCVVSRLVFGKNSFLFSGDIDAKAEKEITKSNEVVQSTVLKVAHHGSKYSTSALFLENINPAAAIIEVGKNSYGHPTAETLQRLENSGIKIFRTDRDGDVKFSSDGKNIYLQK